MYSCVALFAILRENIVPNCLGFEVSWVRSVRTPINCLNILPALIEDYDVTSDALTFWCQLLQWNLPEVSTYEF